MPRERTKLTDKQERILVQAQLMGLTPRDMQQIGNRLIALQNEARDRAEIAEVIEGFTWSKDEEGRWVIITPEGHHCHITKAKTGRSHYWETTHDYNIKVTKPGTAFKARSLQKKTVSFRHEWRAKLCPENSKELYGLIKYLDKHLKWELAKK